MKNLQCSSVFWSQRAIGAHGRQKPYFRCAGSCRGQKALLGEEEALRCISCTSISDFMKILIALTSRSTVNNKILISAYWIAFFSYIGVSTKFIVINVSQKFIAWGEKIISGMGKLVIQNKSLYCWTTKSYRKMQEFRHIWQLKKIGVGEVRMSK